jgi:hypothetical protein
MALVGSINAPNDFGFKNRIINGQMQVAQRATSNTITAASTIAAGYSTVDRFYVYCTGANVTAAQVAGAGATKNRLRITGAASVTAVGIGQRIEQLNSYDLAGSTATLSADLAISATLTTVTWTASYANTADTFGTLASPTITQIATGTFTVSATVTNFNAQITIPAAATTGIQILFTVGALTSGLTWTVGNVQLEKGSTATSFDYRPYGTELVLCQRYYWQSTSKSNGAQFFEAPGAIISATQARINFFLPAAMRGTPAVAVNPAYNTGSGWQINLTGIDNYVLSEAPAILAVDAAASGGGNHICIIFTTTTTMSSTNYGRGAVAYAPTGTATNNFQFYSEL